MVRRFANRITAVHDPPIGSEAMDFLDHVEKAEGLPHFESGGDSQPSCRRDLDAAGPEVKVPINRAIVRSLLIIVGALSTVLIVDITVLLTEPTDHSVFAIAIVAGNLMGVATLLLFKFLVISPVQMPLRSSLWFGTFAVAFIFGEFYNMDLFEPVFVSFVGGMLFALTLSLISRRMF